MRVLLACEESGVVRDAFIRRGHDAWSCDILPTHGEFIDNHYMTDIRDVLYDDWDMVLAFPPCTHLAVSGAAHFAKKRADGRQKEGIDFFMLFTNLTTPKVVIENPVGIMSSVWRKPDQIIQPYEFGEPFSKKTCLWLKGVPPLKPTNIVDRGERITFASGKSMPKWYSDAFRLPPKERSIARSRTFQGIADAMAEQWGQKEL